MKLINKKYQQGQSLIEAVFVIALSGLILSGLVFGIIYFNRVSRVSKERSSAVDLTEERIEYLRYQKRNEGDGFWSDLESYAETEELDGGFTRVTEVTEEVGAPNNRIKVTVTVSWQDGDETRSVNISSYLTKY